MHNYLTLPKTVSVFCNRGTSGIDGSSSTAIGAAYDVRQPHPIANHGRFEFFFMTSMPCGMTIGSPILGSSSSTIREEVFFEFYPAKKTLLSTINIMKPIHHRNAKKSLLNLSISITPACHVRKTIK